MENKKNSQNTIKIIYTQRQVVKTKKSMSSQKNYSKEEKI